MKRFLSIFLAAIMVLSFIPAAGAVTYPGGTEPPETYEYVFTNAAHSTGTGGYSLIGNKPEAEDTIETVSPNKWGYGGTRGTETEDFYSVNLATYAGYLNWSFSISDELTEEDTTQAMAPEFNPDKVERFPVFLLEINVPNTGMFVPVLEYRKLNSSSTVEVFLVKNDEAGEPLTGDAAIKYAREAVPADRLGTVDMHTTGNEISGCRKAFPERKVEAGTYYLVFVANGFDGTPEWTNSIKKYISRNRFESFRLEPVATGAVAKYVFNTAVTGTESGQVYKFISNVAGDTVDTAQSDDYEYEAMGKFNRYTVENTHLRLNYKPADTSYKPWVALQISVPYPGKYSVTVDGWNFPKDGYSNGSTKNTWFGADAFFYIIPAEGTFNKAVLCAEQTKVGHYKFYGHGDAEDQSVPEQIGTFNAEVPGEYWLVIDLGHANGAENAVEAAGYTAAIYGARINSISLTNLGLTDAQIAAASARVVNPENAASNDVTLGNESAEIKVLTSTVAADEGALVNDLCSNAAVGSAQSVTAPVIEKREFLYWTSGIGTDRKIVCETEKYDFTAQKGVTYLTAVYRDMTSDYVSVIFLNGNGELISRSDATYKEGNTIDIETLPTLTGFGAASGWQLAGTKALYTPSDEVIAAGKVMVFVAQYANEETSIDITVNGGTMEVENGKTAPAYGDKVTVTAPSREGGSGYNVFAYWTKTVNDGEAAIVSLDKEYSFNAWEDCTLTAVYTEQQIEPLVASVRKILLGTMNNNINIAEFIGCDGAIERGILYGEGTPTVDNWSNKISMTTANNALSVINNSGKNARAYAIFENAVIYSE
ncbi:MAG: hypothetical protein E7441_00460 [Ruminococcaceae bacterium]|nr:hypothetical protein [Oscillospiraceae bacterium]